MPVVNGVNINVYAPQLVRIHPPLLGHVRDDVNEFFAPGHRV